MRIPNAGFSALLLLPLAVANAVQDAAILPDGPGKAAVEKVCSTCHAIENVIAARRTKIGWERMVEDMVARGAEGSDEEMAAVVSYLTRHFGKINVNTASPKDLEKTLATREAEAIVSYREKNGRIKDFEELRKIPGAGAEKLDAKRSLIAFAL